MFSNYAHSPTKYRFKFIATAAHKYFFVLAQ